jgi:hypothetical protein
VISEGGELRVSDDSSAEIRGVIEPLKADEVTWSGGAAWNVRYGLGRSLEPDRERV